MDCGKVIELAGIKVSSRDGKYLMRDVYKASGEGVTKKPDIFFRNKGTAALLEYVGDSVIRERGPTGGVWASEEIVCAYAMWISPEFYIKVIRTFMAVAKGNLGEAAEIADTEASRLAALKLATVFIDSDRMMLSASEKVRMVEHQAEKVATGESYMDRVISKTQVTIQETLHGYKAGLTKYELIRQVLRHSQFVMGYHLSGDAVLQLMDDMAESGSIRYQGDKAHYVPRI